MPQSGSAPLPYPDTPPSHPVASAHLVGPRHLSGNCAICVGAGFCSRCFALGEEEEEDEEEEEEEEEEKKKKKQSRDDEKKPQNSSTEA